MDTEALREPAADLEARLKALETRGAENRMALVVFSGDLDRVMAALIMATGAAAMGLEVSMFFTFWGTPVLRSPLKKPGPKDFMGKLFGFMLPKGARKAKLSQAAHGRHGHGHAQVAHEEKEGGLPARTH